MLNNAVVAQTERVRHRSSSDGKTNQKPPLLIMCHCAALVANKMRKCNPTGSGFEEFLIEILSTSKVVFERPVRDCLGGSRFTPGSK
jgi:hypothetical protein